MKKEKAKMAAPKKEKKKKVVEETVVTAPKTISIKMVEYYNTMVVREPIEIKNKNNFGFLLIILPKL